MWSCSWHGCWLIPSSASRFSVSVWRWGAQPLENMVPQLGGLVSVCNGAYSPSSIHCVVISPTRDQWPKEEGVPGAVAVVNTSPLSVGCAAPCTVPFQEHPLRCQHTRIHLTIIFASRLSIMSIFSYRKLLFPKCWEVKVVFMWKYNQFFCADLVCCNPAKLLFGYRSFFVDSIRFCA